MSAARARPPVRRGARRRAPSVSGVAAEVLPVDTGDSLLDVVDNVLTKGVVLSGDLTISVAQVDLIYARLSVLLCSADRVLPPPSTRTRRRGA